MKRTISTIDPNLICQFQTIHLRESEEEVLRDLCQNASNMGEFASEFLTCETNEIGTRDHCDVSKTEDQNVLLGECICNDTPC